MCAKAYADAAAHDAALCGLLKGGHGVDMVVLAGYLSMIGPRVLAAYRTGYSISTPALSHRSAARAITAFACTRRRLPEA